mgnify:CR=1 FL=1
MGRQGRENWPHLVSPFPQSSRYDKRLVPARISPKPSQNVLLTHPKILLARSVSSHIPRLADPFLRTVPTC